MNEDATQDDKMKRAIANMIDLETTLREKTRVRKTQSLKLNSHFTDIKVLEAWEAYERKQWNGAESNFAPGTRWFS